MRFRLRTLMIVLAIGPPLTAGVFATRHVWPSAVVIALTVTAVTIPLGFALSWTLASVFQSRR